MVTKDPIRQEQWMLALLVGHESGSNLPAALPPMKPTFALPPKQLPTWTPDGNPGHGFFRVFNHRFGSKHDARELNPWVEYLFSPQAAAAGLDTMLEHGRSVLSHGKAGAIFLRRTGVPAPLFAVPDGDLLTGVGAFPTFPAARRTMADAAMAEYVSSMRPLGGKRYLSGYLTDRSATEWAAHYGNVWSAFRNSKLKFDPRQLLNPGFIAWS
jgi:FAD/FMN-containing dehydrogenase